MLRRAGDRGSVLLLVPAAVLVVVVLASIAVDFTIAFLGEREVANLAAAAANDAATAAVDQAHLRATGEFRLDPALAEEVVRTTLDASSKTVDLGRPVVEITTVGGEPAVRVELTGTVDYIFARALPNGPDGTEVSATAVAVASPG